MMADFFDYIQWRGDVPFYDNSITEVDGLILSTFSYITPTAEFLGRLPATIEELFQSIEKLSDKRKAKLIRTEDDLKLIEAMAGCDRFKNIKILSFKKITDKEKEMQFAAYCLELKQNFLAIVFRGTDHSIVGWKEDFNMGFMDTIPGQLQAAKFLKKEMAKYEGNLIICGHSKGGNQAVYTAVTCDSKIESRILGVYNYDGPGFSDEFVKSEQYQRLVDRIYSFLPDSSIVGLLFEHDEPVEVVESRNNGILQHEPYSWNVMGNKIVRQEQRSNASFIIDEAIHDWLDKLTSEQIKEFVGILFGILDEENIESLEDLVKVKNLIAARKKYSESSDEEKNVFSKSINQLAKSISTSMKNNRRQERESDN